MNLIYTLSAYPFGKLSDTMSHTRLLVWGLIVLIAADIVLAINNHWGVVLLGVVLWGLHMGMTQGLLAAMIAGASPADLRGTAYGFLRVPETFIRVRGRGRMCGSISEWAEPEEAVADSGPGIAVGLSALPYWLAL